MEITRRTALALPFLTAAAARAQPAPAIGGPGQRHAHFVYVNPGRGSIAPDRA